MSILLAAATQIVKTDSPPSAADQMSPPRLIGMTAGWVIISLFLCATLGVFRKRSIIGPSRLEASDSALALLLIFLGSFFAANTIAIFTQRFFPVDPQVRVLFLNLVISGLAFLSTVLVVAATRRDNTRKFGLRPIQFVLAIFIGAGSLFILFPLVSVTGELTAVVMHALHLPDPKPHEVLQDLTNFSDKRFKYLAIGGSGNYRATGGRTRVSRRSTNMPWTGFSVDFKQGKRNYSSRPAMGSGCYHRDSLRGGFMVCSRFFRRCFCLRSDWDTSTNAPGICGLRFARTRYLTRFKSRSIYTQVDP